MLPASDPRTSYSGMCEDPSVCRDFLRNVCKRGKKCKFKHPPSEECERLRRLDKTFCHDFQNSTCRRPNCKFLHYTKEEEEIFRRTGYLPHDMQWPYRSASNTYDEKTPICKDFTNGACNRGSNCKYRHISQQMQESVNQALYSQPNVQETGFVNKNMPSGHFNPSMFSISNPDNSSHFRQSSFINNAVIVSPTDSLLNPVSSGYIPGGSSHSLVGLIGNTSTGQPTLYTAHSSLVSLTSARHITPCSSVLTVGADPIHHPNVIHPQTGLSAHHATYHIVPHDASPHHHHHHHHLLATSSSHSHAPTLLTIPLSQFTCNVSNNSLIQSQAAIACSTQHHAVVTGVLPAHPSISTAPAAYFPSYGVFQINQPTLETCDQQVKTEIHKQVHETKQSTCSTAAPATTTTTPVVTSATTAATSVSSSTTAVLAAAAAAGYIAQHLPVIGSNNLSGSSNISQEHNNNLILNPSKGVNVHESAIAAAANLPTVSAAAAAAVAAAAAFACSTSISQNSKCCALLSNVQTKLNEIDPESGSFAFLPHNNANNNNNAAAAASNNNNNDNSNYNNVNNSTTLNNVESFSCQDPTYLSTNIKSDNDDPTTNTKTMITNNYNFQNRLTRESSYTLDNANTNNNNNNNMNSNCEKSTSSFDSLSNSTPSSSEYLNPTDEEQAKTAAAVAAAACIGAIFSQPMAAVAAAASGGGVGGGVGSNVAKNSAPSSVAAMLVENLIGCNQQDFIYAVQSSTSSLSSSYGSSLLSKSSRQINNKCNTNSTSSCHSQQQMKKQCHMTTEKSTNDQSEHSGAEGGRGIGNANHHSTNYHSIQSNTVNNSPQTSSSSDRCKCSNPLLDSQYSLQDAITSDAANWSSVTTTMASAAKAVAAAAAVAATAAVTGSANFFRLTQFKNKMNSQLERIPYSSTTSSYPSTSNVYSSLHCNDDQFKNSQLNTEKLSSTSIDKTQLNTDLSTKKAVTMTSAAAAAAMVAAAATVAAEQHQLIGKSFLSEVTYSNKSEKQPTRRVINGNSRLLNTNCNYHRTYSSSSSSAASHNDFNSPLSSYETDNRMYHLTHESNQYPPMKRHKSKRMTPIDCHYTDYSNLHHHSNLRESVDDYEDDDADVYEDDDIESTTLMSPSPEVTPPYNLSKKLSKCKKLLNFSSYPHQIDDDSRLVSCETSPNPWRSTNCNIILHRTINNHLSNTIFHCLRRSLSTSSIPSKSTYGIILKMRSKSFPVIQSHCQKDEKRSLFTYLLKDNNHKYNSMDNYQSMNNNTVSTSLFSSKKSKVGMKRFQSSSSSSSLRYRNPLCIKQKFRRYSSTQLSNSTATTTTTNNNNNNNSNRPIIVTTTRRRQRRPISNVSPTSILSEEYNGHDEGDDPDFVYPDYDDDDDDEDDDDDDDDDVLYELSVPQTSSIKHSSHSISSKYSAKRKRSLYTSSTVSNIHLTSASLKQQQYALKVENARLRRKLFDLLRQRGDLRAANEVLLEQNARLRQSSKRVSVVARMAESATKIIEAHNKSKLTSSSSSSSISASNSSQSSSVPFSIAQAAAAVVAAAAQNQTNPSVYVSSPTSVNNQQNSATISALGDGSDGGDGFSLHSLFPKIASANTISTDGITIPSNQTLTAVQIQSTPQLPQATALIQHHHPQALNSQQQTGISNYYQHQMNHSIDTLAASIGNTSVSPTQQNNISQSSSTFQVCHNPIVSIANVFPKLSHDASSENAKLIPMGVPNTLTVVLDENTPQTPTYTIPSSVSSHSSVSLQIPVTVGAHLTPIVSCSSHQDPTKLVVSVTYPNQDVAAVAAAAAVTAVNVIPSTTSTQHTSSNRINTQTCVIPNHQIQIVHKLTSGHQTTCKK